MPKLKVDLVVDDKGSLVVSRFGNNVINVMDSAGKRVHRFGKRELAMAGAAVTALIATIGKFSIAAASDLEETQGKFDVVFRGLTEEAEGWSKTLQESFLLSETASKKYLASIQDLLVPTGMARDEAGAMSSQFVQLAADLGSFNNLPTEQVVRDIQSALQGSSETMAKYGVNVKAAKVEQEILNQGWVKSKKDITDAHKAQAILNITLRQTSDAHGDLSRTMGSYANQERLFKKNLEEIQVAIGQGLLPVVTGLTSDMNQWVEANEDILAQDIKQWADDLAIVLGETAQAALWLSERFGNIARSIRLITEIGDNASFWEAAGMGPEETKVFLQQLDDGTLKISRLREELERYQKKVAAIENLTGFRKLANDLAGGKEDLEYWRKKVGGIESELRELESSQRTLNYELDDGVLLLGEIPDAFIEAFGGKSQEAVTAAKGEVSGFVEEFRKLNDIKFSLRKALDMGSEQGPQLPSFEFPDSPLLKNILDTSDFVKESETSAADMATAYRDMYDDMSHSAEEDFTHRVELLNAQAEQYEALMIDRASIDAWYAAEYAELEDEKLLKTGDFFDGIRLGYEQLLDDQITWAEAGKDIFTTFADESAGALSSNLFDAIQGDFDNLGDAWDSLWKTMLKTLTDIIAQMVVAWAAAKVADVASAFVFHDGKWDVGNTFLGNKELASDEVPAILQMGEMVIPRQQAQIIRDNMQNGGGSTETGMFDQLAEEAATAEIGLGSFGSHLAAEFGKDMTVGAGYVASAGNVSGVIDGITSVGNISQNVMSAASSAILDEMGIDPTAQTLGKIGGGLAAVATGLGAVSATAAGFAASVGIDGLMDAFGVRELESVKDEIEGNLGHFAGRMAFKDFTDAQEEQLMNTPGLDEGQSNLDTYSDMPDSDDLGDTPGYAKYGGMFDGPESGYPMVLHGKEAVVPLPNGGSIPVEMRGGNSPQSIYIESPIYLDGKVIDTISQKMEVVADQHIVRRAQSGLRATERAIH